MQDPFFKVVQATCMGVDTPRSLAVYLLVEHSEWAQISRLSVNPLDYLNAEAYYQDAVVTDLLRKCDLDSGIDREKAACETFLLCEEANAKTNLRLNRYLPKSLFLETASEAAVHEFILMWRKEIQLIIGAVPLWLTPRFSQGATYADSNGLTTVPDKMSSRPTVYEHSRDVILPFWWDTSWGRAVMARSSSPTSVRGNIFFTVPKDGKTFRGCCKEASLNVSHQLDVGRFIRTRLRTIGIDLSDGQELHRRAASAASKANDYATIDMSNASDTLCRVLPELALPAQWYTLLDSLRAKFTLFDGHWVRLEKFSSMGNGFTFELETLIFASLARTIIKSKGRDPFDVMCYGDDLIVPTADAADVLAALRWFGFQPNLKKTFLDGPFRESCGGDFWLGEPVRAHFVKEIPYEPQHWISLANGLRRVMLTRASFQGKLKRAWHIALDQIPSEIARCRGPSYLGDIVLHDVEERWGYAPTPKRDHDPSWSIKYVWGYVPIPNVIPWSHWKGPVQLASCTLGASSVGVTPRGSISGFIRKRVPLFGEVMPSQWLPFGSK